MTIMIMNKSFALITHRGGGKIGRLPEAQKSYEHITVTGQREKRRREEKTRGYFAE